MADFTTWSALLTSVRNALSNRDLSIAQYRTPDGTMVTARSLSELRELEGWASAKAAAEAAGSGVPSRRTYAKPQGNAW